MELEQVVEGNGGESRKRKMSQEGSISDERRNKSAMILSEYNLLDVRRMCREIQMQLNTSYDEYVRQPAKRETPLCTCVYPIYVLA